MEEDDMDDDSDDDDMVSEELKKINQPDIMLKQKNPFSWMNGWIFIARDKHTGYNDIQLAGECKRRWI